LNALPGIKELRLKVRNYRDFPESLKPMVSRISKSTAEELTRDPLDSPSTFYGRITGFPFLKLPNELQLMVLSHTGLVFQKCC
jgi:hypothetical protein